MPTATLSPAETAKTFIAGNRFGALSTLSHTMRGYPFGSVIQYDLDRSGQAIIFISSISQHYQNLRQDPRASILVADTYGAADPQAFARATLLVDFEQCREDEREQLLASYWRRFPDNPSRSVAHDFAFFRGKTMRVRWIGGFGDIRWIDAQDYDRAPVDEIAYTSAGAIAHMNRDHRGALAELVRHYAGVTPPPDPLDCRMSALTCRDLTITVASGGNEEKFKQYRIAFPRKLSAPAEVREEIIGLLQQCRKAAAEE